METDISKLKNYYEYAKGIYQYKTQKGYTLIQDGKILYQNVKYCRWYNKGVYKYKTQKGYTLVEDGKILCENVKDCRWYKKGVYEYKTQKGKIIKIENGNRKE